MALTEQRRVRQIILDFPTADGYTLRYREAVDLMSDGEFYQELRVSEPMPVVAVDEPIPSALSDVFGAKAADIIAGSHAAALAHEERLQEVVDQTARADAAEQLAEREKQRADTAEGDLKVAQEQLLSLQQRFESAESRLIAAQQALAEPATEPAPI